MVALNLSVVWGVFGWEIFSLDRKDVLVLRI